MKAKTMICLTGTALLAVTSQAAIPEVTEVEMSQSYGSPDAVISYRLTGAPAVITVDIETNAVINGVETWASIGGRNIQTFTEASDVFRTVSEDGVHTMVWKATEDWPGYKLRKGIRAVVTAWNPRRTPDYMVVDICASAMANSQHYYPSEEFIPGGGVLSRECYRKTKIVMRRIHARHTPWMMGTSTYESDHSSDSDKELLHRATLTNDYYIGVFPVTQAQWTEVAGYGLFQFSGSADDGLRPADNLSYNEIRCADGSLVVSASGTVSADSAAYWPHPPYGNSFLGKLNARTGLDFDFPTEAQWDFACRVGGKIAENRWNTDTPRKGGDAQDDNCPGANKYNGKTTKAVGTYAPNEWGLYDMHGNVWEWCLDWFSYNISALKGRVNISTDNPSSPDAGAVKAVSGARSMRGGCGGTALNNCRWANRGNASAENRLNWYGVRLACRAGLR